MEWTRSRYRGTTAAVVSRPCAPTGGLEGVDSAFQVTRAERGRPVLAALNAAAWGDARIAPVHSVSASIAVAEMTLPRLRYLCRPDVWAFDGTEAV